MKTTDFIMTFTLCSIIFFGCIGKRPTVIGIKNGKLMPCPKKPNCVNSQDNDPKHFIAPITYNCSKDNAIEKIKNIVQSQKRTKIVEETKIYLRTEFTTAIMRYVDDVEFYFPDEKTIQVRSASRIGYSDLGLNRRRIEKIRKAFNEK